MLCWNSEKRRIYGSSNIQCDVIHNNIVCNFATMFVPQRRPALTHNSALSADTNYFFHSTYSTFWPSKCVRTQADPILIHPHSHMHSCHSTDNEIHHIIRYIDGIACNSNLSCDYECMSSRYDMNRHTHTDNHKSDSSRSNNIIIHFQLNTARMNVFASITRHLSSSIVCSLHSFLHFLFSFLFFAFILFLLFLTFSFSSLHGLCNTSIILSVSPSSRLLLFRFLLRRYFHIVSIMS